MKILEKILVAVDFSKESEVVLLNAMEVAKTFNSKVSLMYVLPDGLNNKNAEKLLKEAAENKLAQSVSLLKEAGVDVDDFILEFGVVLDKVIKAADRIKANLILVGAGDKAENEIFKLGTTAEKIVRKSKQPVWVVKENKKLVINKILCPVDFSKESKRALKNAITFAHRFDAELIVLSICKSVYSDSLLIKLNMSIEDEKCRVSHNQEMDEFLEGFNFSNLNWKKIVKGGEPYLEILDVSDDENVDLIIMGTTGKSMLSRILMGSVTEKVIREVPCSFITMKAEDAISVRFESRIRNVEKHYKNAVQLQEDGLYEEAILEFKECLLINDMHLSSLKGLASVYEKIGDAAGATKYSGLFTEVVKVLWDQKIEDEVRNMRKY